MEPRSIAKSAALFLCIVIVGACAPEPEVEATGTDGPEGVVNRVKIGESSWVVDFDDGGPVAEAGAVESIEISNDSSQDIVPDVGLSGNVSFILISDECLEVLKPGESCIVRGQWVEESVRQASVVVTASTQDGDAEPVTRSISVPLEANADSPSDKTVPPSPSTTLDPSPSPTPPTTLDPSPSPTPPTTLQPSPPTPSGPPASSSTGLPPQPVPADPSPTVQAPPITSTPSN